jgi:hypothetical protein
MGRKTVGGTQGAVLMSERRKGMERRIAEKGFGVTQGGAEFEWKGDLIGRGWGRRDFVRKKGGKSR